MYRFISVCFLILLALRAEAEDQLMQGIHSFQHVIPARIGLLEALIHSFTHPDTLQTLRSSLALETDNDQRIKRTVKAIFTLIEHGFASAEGQASLNHIKLRHQVHDTNLQPEAMRHTLSCFVVSTVRAIKNIAKNVTKEEQQAITHFYQTLGHELGMNVPASYQEFEQIFDNTAQKPLSEPDLAYVRKLAKRSLNSAINYFFWPCPPFLGALFSFEEAIVGLFDERTRQILGQAPKARLSVAAIVKLHHLYYQQVGRFETRKCQSRL